jgi:hypothetical protein
LAEARRQALRAFGGVDRYAEESRDARGVAWLDELRRDARIGLRQLWRNPQFSAAAILTLGIGVGATTAIFTAVDTVLLRSSPFATGDRLVVIWETDRASGTLHEPASWPDIVDMRERATSFVSIAALMGVDGTLTGDGPAERVSVLAVTANVFEVLGVSPLAGRVFEAGSGPLAGAAHGMLSERYWRSRFNADRAIVGSTLMISGRPITITGVLPAEADLGVAQIHARADYSVPIVDPRIDLWLAMDPTEEMRAAADASLPDDRAARCRRAAGARTGGAGRADGRARGTLSGERRPRCASRAALGGNIRARYVRCCACSWGACCWCC